MFLYHIHNKICNHSSNEVQEIVDYALKHDFKAIYFCEHCPLPGTQSSHYKYSRVKYSQLFAYKKEISDLSKKHKQKIKLYLGYETECSQENRYYFEKLARDPICEFMICGNHFYNNVLKEEPLIYTCYDTKTKDQLKQYWINLEAALESRTYSWIAHPEIFLNSYQKWDNTVDELCKKIIASAIKYDIPLGFNINYTQPKSVWHYPVEKFWKMVANSPVKVIIENDSHDISTIQQEWVKQNYALAYKWGLEKNIIKKPQVKFFDKKPQVIFIQNNLYHLLTPSLCDELNKNKCQVVAYQQKKVSYFIDYLKQHNIHPVWSIVVSNDQKLCNELNQQTSCYIVSKNNYDLPLETFSKIKNWKQLLLFFEQIKEQI